MMNPMYYVRRWILFYSFILIAWFILYWQGDHSAHRNHLMVMDNIDFFILILNMWLLMVVAMMMPTLVPTLNVLNNIYHQQSKKHQWMVLYGFIASYIFIWLLFSAVLATLQYILWKWQFFGIDENHLWVLLLAFAGLYQFSDWKERNLQICQNPMIFFLQNWREGIRGSFSMGFQQGLYCLQCCWALMLLCLITGAMQIFWMGILMLVMILEKISVFRLNLSQFFGKILLLFALYWGLQF